MGAEGRRQLQITALVSALSCNLLQPLPRLSRHLAPTAARPAKSRLSSIDRTGGGRGAAGVAFSVGELAAAAERQYIVGLLSVIDPEE